MSGLVHISKYLNEFKVELDNYDRELTKRADDVSTQVKHIQEELSKLSVLPFYHWWSVAEDDGNFLLSVGLGWNGTRVLFLFEENEPEVLLGANRETRVSTEKYLIPFLEAGLKQIKDKTAQLSSKAIDVLAVN